MIARMTLSMGHRQVVATFEDDYEWRCEDLLISTFLNAMYGKQAKFAPGVGAPGHRQARAAARTAEDAGWTVDLRLIAAEQSVA